MKKKFKKTGLPTYEIVVNMEDETGIRLVSLVKSPAIELKGMYFNEDEDIVEKNYAFVSNKEEQMIIGPALIPYKKIYRVDPDTNEEYNVVFTPQSIKNIVNKFNRSNNNKSINLEHTNQMVNGYIAENWIVKNSVYDTSRAYGLNLQEGSWVICVKIEDKNFWNNEVKEQGIYGFSVEGLLGQKLISLSRLELSGEKISFDYHGVLNIKEGTDKAKQMIADGYDVYIVTDASKEKSGRLISEKAKELGIPESKIHYAEGNKPKVLKDLGIKAHYDNNSNIVDKIDKGGVVDGRQFEEMLSKLNENELIELSDDILEYIEVEFGRKRYDLRPRNFDSYWHTHPYCNCSFEDGVWSFEESADGKYPCDLCVDMASKYEKWYKKRGGGKSAAPGSKQFSSQIELESFSDYPDGVKNNAKKVLDWTEKNGWGSCGTPVGKTRANQLANGEAISLDTVKRMYSYLSRHEVDLETSKSFSDGCGYLMYMAWGGKAALGWSRNKLRQLGELDENNKIIEQFVEPNKGEKETEFISRCISYVINKGETSDEKQAYAICKTKWDNKK